MAIIAKAGSSDFTPCPAGTQQSVCCDVIDLGMMTTTFVDEKTKLPKVQHKIEIVWQSSELMPNDKPFLVKKRYTLSLHDRARLRHDLESWRGKAFTDAEAEGFDVEQLLGVNAFLNVIHNPGTKGGVFANVAGVMPLPKNMPPIVVSEYVRVCERQKTAMPDDDKAPNDEEIPF